MSQKLPFAPSIPVYRFRTDLLDTQYIFDVRWNERTAAWYFDLSTEDGTLLRAGVKIVLGTLLGVTCASPDWPDGIFVASDTSNTGVDATLDDLGTRVQVFFYPSSELPDL